MASKPIEKGCLLIAEPFLGDPNFERSVVLLCDHHEEGSFGFVLNQITQISLPDVLDGVIFSEIPLYVGGPVEKNTLHFIHRLPELIEDSTLIQEGLYWGGDYEQVKTLINLGKIRENDIRFFLGYSGWGNGQLEGELTDKVWITTQVESGFIFETPAEQFWRSILRKMGGKHKILSNYPLDPRLN
ncbi:MAG: YqgE/AlgH family protein [Microscillaceae bacterium]|nr:YqgE/AlgH family protein [Microscillaceae bacterium]